MRKYDENPSNICEWLWAFWENIPTSWGGGGEIIQEPEKRINWDFLPSRFDKTYF